MLKPTKAKHVSVHTDDGRTLDFTAPCVVTIHPPAGTQADVDEFLQKFAPVMTETPTGESVLALQPADAPL